jgi:hypothetical protein
MTNYLQLTVAKTVITRGTVLLDAADIQQLPIEKPLHEAVEESLLIDKLRFVALENVQPKVTLEVSTTPFVTDIPF